MYLLSTVLPALPLLFLARPSRRTQSPTYTSRRVVFASRHHTWTETSDVLLRLLSSTSPTVIVFVSRDHMWTETSSVVLCMHAYKFYRNKNQCCEPQIDAEVPVCLRHRSLPRDVRIQKGGHNNERQSMIMVVAVVTPTTTGKTPVLESKRV